MKGRKTIGKAIALGLAVCAMFGLVSCASVSSKAKHMKSQEVSEAAWEKIFGYGADFDVVFSDCEVVYQREMTRETYIDGVKSKITSSETYTFVMDGAKQYLSVSSSQKGKYGDIKVDEEEPEEERYSIKNEDGTTRSIGRTRRRSGQLPFPISLTAWLPIPSTICSVCSIGIALTIMCSARREEVTSMRMISRETVTS